MIDPGSGGSTSYAKAILSGMMKDANMMAHCDIRDCAELHMSGLLNPATKGMRLAVVERTCANVELSALARDEFSALGFPMPEPTDEVIPPEKRWGFDVRESLQFLKAKKFVPLEQSVSDSL